MSVIGFPKMRARARVGKNQAHKQFDSRGLPRPIRPEKTKHFAALDLHGQAFQRPFFLKVQEPERVVLGQIFNFNRCAWHALILRKHEPYRQSVTPTHVRGKKIESPWQEEN